MGRNITLHAKNPEIDKLPEVREWLDEVGILIERRVNQRMKNLALYGVDAVWVPGSEGLKSCPD